MLTSERVARADVVNLCHTRMSDEVYVDLLILTDMIAENCCISIGSYANLNQEDDRRPSLRFIPSAPSHPSSIGLMWRDTLWRQLHPNKAVMDLRSLSGESLSSNSLSLFSQPSLRTISTTNWPSVLLYPHRYQRCSGSDS